MVLAGGGSRRYGRDKALAEVGGRPMARRVADALAGAGAEEVRVVGGDAEGLGRAGLTVVADRWPGAGPLGGLRTALADVGNAPWVVVCACDLPHLTPAVVDQVVSRCPTTVADAVVPVVAGRRQPLAAAYRRSAAPALAAVWEAGGRSMQAALVALEVEEVVVEGAAAAALDDRDRPWRGPDRGSPSGSLAGSSAGGPWVRTPRRSVDIPQIDVAELEQRLAGGATVLDVRNPDEYERGHVAGAALIPLPELPDRLGEVPDGDPLLVICQAGGRSQRACELLAEEGRSVANVAGGTGAWIESGRPVVTGSDPG